MPWSVGSGASLRQGRSNQTGALLMTLAAAIKDGFVYTRR
jgi:hypothetical protein